LASKAQQKRGANQCRVVTQFDELEPPVLVREKPNPNRSDFGSSSRLEIGFRTGPSCAIGTGTGTGIFKKKIGK